VSRTFQRLSLAGAALTANAFRPLQEPQPLNIPSFFGAWLTAELAPHNIAVTLAGTAAFAATHRGRFERGDRAAIALNLASAAGLVVLMNQGRHSRHVLEDALGEALGPDYAQQLDPVPTAADLAVPWRDVAKPYTLGRHPDVEVIRDIQYAGQGRRHQLDIYRHRETPTDAPVLLQIHGGAWTIGAKHQQGIPLMMHLAARGWVCVSINYRLSPKHAWPAHLEDCKSALIWIRQHISEYGGDPAYVAVTGGSAGGHLTAMLALTANDPQYQRGSEDVDTTVQAAVPHYGIYDFSGSFGTRRARDMRDRFLAPWVMKRKYAEDPRAYDEASPIKLVRPDAPPFFVIHGTHDSLASVDEAREFAARLREVSKEPVVYAELPGTQHAFDVFPSIRSGHVLRAVERFLNFARLEAKRRDAAEPASA
jgi:acetyl esterase/lipase